MKNIFFLLTLILFNYFFVSAQSNDLTKLLGETQKVARKTAYQAWVEYTSSHTQISEDKNKNKRIFLYESLCSRKICQDILVSKNGLRLSEKQINKNREKAAKYLDKAEKRPDDTAFSTDKENSLGYGILISNWYSPSLYLNVCKTDLVEKSAFENRTTYKIRVTNCDLEKLPESLNKDNFQFMLKTQGFIWIDEQDKAAVKMELYARNEFPNLSKSEKPLVIIEAARVPEGYWFWKIIKIESLENPAIFPGYEHNWQYEFYDYRLSNVEVNKVELNK